VNSKFGTRVDPFRGTLAFHAGVDLAGPSGTKIRATQAGRVEFAGVTESQTHFGWTLGGGVEVGLTPNWSAKAEYLYVRLEDRGYVLTGVNNGFQSNVFRLGVNYRF